MSEPAILSCAGLRKSFGRFQALSAVDISVGRGEALGVVGPNGAGKTTLFAILAGALRPSDGSIAFEGRDVTSMDASQRCRYGIVRTHQIPRPFLGMTVIENVLVAAMNGGGLSGEAAWAAAEAALEQTELAQHAARPTQTLGLLDRKRLELARALAMNPRVLLLDEIGGGLTEAELEGLLELVARLKRSGMTIVWIEHVLHALVASVDRLICMSEGRVIAEGAPAAVMADKAVAQTYLGRGVQ
ncbi:ABC transporter ATP-binding protein [Pelagibacterium limicola]|uniref:ABC transporter ATP-binding protein n=1 Tax=Pelagibacterium limicola TaxID=2791022 RepID=UPI0018AF7C3A|nr:ATP-binding cassette domain-containing protein [Pelagibacterium limicola]